MSNLFGNFNNRNINSKLHTITVFDDPMSVKSTSEDYLFTSISKPPRTGLQADRDQPYKVCGIKIGEDKDTAVPKCFKVENVTHFTMKRSSTRNPSYEQIVYYKTYPTLNSGPSEDLCGVNDTHLEGYRTEICPLKTNIP